MIKVDDDFANCENVAAAEKFVSGEEGFEALGRDLTVGLPKREGAQRQSDLGNLKIEMFNISYLGDTHETNIT